VSSTKRGARRIEADYYPTPESAFKPIIPFLPKDGQLWDPAWGDTRLVKWMLEAGLDADGTDLHDKEHPTDYLTDLTNRHCVITNPPFTQAFSFCQHAVAYSLHSFMLLRLGFLASQARRAWFQRHEPCALFILSERPSFAASVRCSRNAGLATQKKCHYQVMIPAEQERPKKCPLCGSKVKVTTSDSADYAWVYWYQGQDRGSIRPPLYRGIYHV